MFTVVFYINIFALVSAVGVAVGARGGNYRRRWNLGQYIGRYGDGLRVNISVRGSVKRRRGICFYGVFDERYQFGARGV